MLRSTVFCAGKTPALQYTRRFLEFAGIQVTAAPSWDTNHLLLDVPSFRPGLWIEQELDTLLTSLPQETIIWGGNLSNPGLDRFHCIDLLKDEEYLLQNAAITASCTIPIAEAHLKSPWKGIPVLLIGWGRISKALVRPLKKKGCSVTIATGQAQKYSQIQQMGCTAADTSRLSESLPDFRLIINTAPALVLSESDCALCRDCIKIDLASQKGIQGSDVLWARGLPGRFAPERSGKLIADTFLRLSKEVSP